MQPKRHFKWNAIRTQSLLPLSGQPTTWPPKSKQSNVKTLGTFLVSKTREMIKTTPEGEDEVAVVEEEEEVTEEAEAVAEAEAGAVGEVVATRMLGITVLMTGASSIRSSVTKS